jgi:Ca2+/Na+ antiporter
MTFWFRLQSPTTMSENPLDLVWLIAGALAVAFGLASLVLAIDAVRRRYPGIVTVFGVLAVVFGVLVVAAGFVAIALLVLHWAVASTN